MILAMTKMCLNMININKKNSQSRFKHHSWALEGQHDGMMMTIIITTIKYTRIVKNIIILSHYQLRKKNSPREKKFSNKLIKNLMEK